MMSERKIIHFLNLAKRICYESDNKKTRVGCIVVYKGQIISTGCNMQDKTSPIQKEYNIHRGFNPDESGTKNTIHAECMALSKIKYKDIDYKKINIFVYRIKKNGTKGMARPCPACEAMMRNLGISHVYYTTENGWAYERYE